MKRLLVILLSLALLLACVPTPEEEFVVNKGGTSEYPAVISSGQNSGLESIPSEWSESFSVGVADIQIQANVDMPVVSAMDVYSAHMSGPRIDSINRFLPLFVNEPVCTLPVQDEAGVPLKTKAELEAEMKAIRNRIDNVDANHPAFTDAERSDYLAAQNAELDALAASYAAAPEASETIVSDLKQVFEKQRYAQVRLYADGDALLRGTAYLGMDGFTIEGLRTDNRAVSDQPVSSVQIAKETADRLIKEIGLDNEYAFVGSSEGVGGISAWYGRVIHGVPFSQSINCDTDEPYNTGFTQERIRFCFFRDGYALSEISWSGSFEIDGVETKSCTLLPFPDVEKSVCAALNAHLAWQPEEIRKTEIEITSISLGYRLIRKPNTNETYLVVPVWSVTGSVQNRTEINGSEISDFLKLQNNIILVLNAVDGSLIWFYR